MEVIRNLQKRGAKNREMNASLKEAMALILKTREEKKKKDEEEIAAKKAMLAETKPV